MRRNLSALCCGILFGVGLTLSQMVNPNKVLDFLDVTGNWDPSLMFVLMGALAVAMFLFRAVLKRAAPVLENNFQLPTKKSVDKLLVLGSAIFGVGWGMSGYCPGPAVTGLGLFSFESVVMVLSIMLGFVVYHTFFDVR